MIFKWNLSDFYHQTFTAVCKIQKLHFKFSKNIYLIYVDVCKSFSQVIQLILSKITLKV